MATQAQKLQEIANAIRGVTNRNSNFKIKANEFADEILKLDPRIKTYVEPFKNGWYGLEAVRCASSYHRARVLGTDKFAYRQYNILSTPNDEGTVAVRDNGYCKIDCSTFVSLCLRGIPYENSPYAIYEDDERWTPYTVLEDLCGTTGWEFKHLDKQDKYHRDGKTKLFTDIGADNHSSIRTAAHLAEYFYKNGYVVYDRLADGILSSLSDLDRYELEPGDLVFWANPNNENDNVLKRFRSITHCAIVAENTNFYYHVTGSEKDKDGNPTYDQKVVWYQKFDEGIVSGGSGDSTLDDDSHAIGQLLLVCRPDYRPKVKVETPLEINLIGWPWSISREKTFTAIGLTFEALDGESLKINGTGTGTTCALKGYNGTNDHITLSPGTYRLSGIFERYGTAFALQVRDANGNDFNDDNTVVYDKTEKPIRYPVNNSVIDEFTLTKETDVVIKLYCATSVTLKDEIITPRLERIA